MSTAPASQEEERTFEPGWRKQRVPPSLVESHRSIPVTIHGPWWRKMLAFAGPALATDARYICSDGSKLTANFSPPDAAKGSVALTFATGRELKLPQVTSADGGRYADADIEIWIKGRTATLK